MNSELVDLINGEWRVAEFFAGIGLARIGLESSGLKVVWSNDIERTKREMFERHFGDEHVFVEGDIAQIATNELPDDLDLAWASFPCTDLSLAGWRRGINGRESSTFFHFVRLMGELGAKRPSVVAIENVTGFATSNAGDDLRTAVRELNQLEYSVDVFTLDARRFVPQSRPRLFLVGVLGTDTPAGLGSLGAAPNSIAPCPTLRPEWLQFIFNDPELRTHQAPLPEPPPLKTAGLTQLINDLGDQARCRPSDQARAEECWWPTERVSSFLKSLSSLQAERLKELTQAESISHRTAYRRTRQGKAVWEIRADDVSGCLRAVRGGSSKQAVVRAGRGCASVRWMSAREYAALMGASDYRFGGIREQQAMFGFGDAVCVPVVEWITTHYLKPALERV